MAARLTRSSRGLVAISTGNTPVTEDQSRPVRPCTTSPSASQHDRIANGRVTKDRPPPRSSPLPPHSRSQKKTSTTTPTARQQAQAGPQQWAGKTIKPNPRMGKPLAKRSNEVTIESPTNPKKIMIAGRLQDNPLYEPLPLTEHQFFHSPMILTVIDSAETARKVSNKIAAMMSPAVEGDVITIEEEEEDEEIPDDEEQATADTLLVRPKLWSLPAITEQGKRAFLSTAVLSRPLDT